MSRLPEQITLESGTGLESRIGSLGDGRRLYNDWVVLVLDTNSLFTICLID